MRTGGVLFWITLASSPVAVAAEDRKPVGMGWQAAQERLVEQHGAASYYSDRFAGRPTAMGDTFSQGRLTGASPDLPLGTWVTVTNEKNGKSVDVKVNDRGPNMDGRVIDLSKKAAAQIGIKKEGVAPVRIEARPSSQASDELKEILKEKAMHEGGE